MKALPHRSSKYFETVCCAGIGRDGIWRRQYPVPFRILDPTQKFSRWSRIEYKYTKSKNDRRAESQKVLPESFVVCEELKRSERARMLNPLIRRSFEEANMHQESLTLLRPKELSLSARHKSPRDLTNERRKHKELASQMSLFDKPTQPLEPCPVEFSVRWTDQSGKVRNHTCDDWETSTAYMRFLRMYGHEKAIRVLKQKYENEYFNAGIALAFSTHSRRNVTNNVENQWLLVGLIRIDDETQGDLLLG
ncbi:MAG: hypothetical protein QNJ29_10890 [Rhizobiaceae bacterium]|nr:hypothetical protein [Rhizobiaceae bacterium]